MAEWQIRLKVPDNSKPEVYRSLMDVVWKTCKVSKVPKTADWACFKRGTSYFFVATWNRSKEKH